MIGEIVNYKNNIYKIFFDYKNGYYELKFYCDGTMIIKLAHESEFEIINLRDKSKYK